MNNKIIIDQIQSNIKTVIKWDRYSSRINDETLTIKKNLDFVYVEFMYAHI